MSEIKLNGKKYELLMSGEAHFAIDELSKGKPAEAIAGNDLQSFRTLCRMTVELANAAERYHRWLGDDTQPELTAEEVMVTLSPMGVQRLRKAVYEAISDGYKRGVGEDEDVDLGLAELNQKKTNAAR